MYIVPLPLTSRCAGTTGEHIVLVGDSAGGNLAVTTAMKSLECGGYCIIHLSIYTAYIIHNTGTYYYTI